MEIKQVAGEVNKALETYFKTKLEQTEGLEKQVWEHLGEYTLRPSKRLRAALVKCGFELLGGQGENELVKKAMIAVEMVQSGLLMQDDLMDEDDLRRGGMATHKYFEKWFGQNFGMGMAVCLGDMAMMEGVRLLGDSKLAKLLIETIAETGLGQMEDLYFEAKGSATENDILGIHQKKSAKYTVQNPLEMGAVLAGAKEDDVEILTRYAQPLGIAFQLQDDILGMFGDESKTGKAADSDIKQGKMTLLKLKALMGDEKARFVELYGKQAIAPLEVEEIRRIVKDSRSLKYSQELIEKMGNQAFEAVGEMKQKGWNKEAIGFLEMLVEYVTKREK